MSEDLIKFGKNLQKIRKQKGMTQEKLAFCVGLDRSYISDIETGKRNVSLINILKLSTALEIHPKRMFEYIIADEGNA